MANVARRVLEDGKSVWDARYRDPAGAQRKRTFSKKSEAPEQSDIESAAREFGIEWGADARGATATRTVRGDDRGER